MSNPTADAIHARSHGPESDPAVHAIASEAEALGIVRQMSETYLVGDFRYTKLSDAIAQARRMSKLENELL